MGRPKTYPDATVVAVTGKEAKSRLQKGSERRAIINEVVDQGGRTTLSALNKTFGYNIRAKAISLINAKWLEVVE